MHSTICNLEQLEQMMVMQHNTQPCGNFEMKGDSELNVRLLASWHVNFPSGTALHNAWRDVFGAPSPPYNMNRRPLYSWSVISDLDPTGEG